MTRLSGTMENSVFQHHRARCDDRAFPDHGMVHDDRPHADQAAVFNGTSVDHTPVADSDAMADDLLQVLYPLSKK